MMIFEKTIVILILLFGYYRILKDGSVRKTSLPSEVVYAQTTKIMSINKGAPYYEHGKFVCYIKV